MTESHNFSFVRPHQFLLSYLVKAHLCGHKYSVSQNNTTMVPAQSVPSGYPTAAAEKPIDSIHHNVPTTGQYSSSGLRTQRSSDLAGDTQPPSFVSQAASLDDIAQSCDHEKAISVTVSEQRERKRDELSQILDHDALEKASHSSTNTSQATLTGGVQSTHQTSPISSPKVDSTSVDSESLVHEFDETKIPSRLPLSESMGLWACAIIAGGTALTLAILGFLIFLWFGEGPAGGESATYVWRKIMLSESWPAQTITICALVVRTVAAAQAAVCTSLVAALLLERRRLPLSKLIPVSIKRGVNDGPFNLVCEVLSWKYLRRLFCVEIGLLLIVTLVTFSIQFTSTVLLSGFDTATLVQFPEHLQRNVILSAKAAEQATHINSFSQFPPSYATFGELETSDVPDPNAQGVSDTGVKLRSFVPFQEKERLKLRAYRGPALSEKTQVMCMRPNMDAQVSWLQTTSEHGTMPSTSISGTVSYENTFDEAGLDDWTACSSFQNPDGGSQTVCLPQNFTCTLPLRAAQIADPLSVIAFCHLPAEIVENAGGVNFEGFMQYWNTSSPLWSANANTWVYLTLSTNLTVEAVGEELGSRKSSSISLNTPLAKAGEWDTYEVLPTMALNVSLCFAGLQADVYNVSMSTVTDPKEPEVRWDPKHGEDGAEQGQLFMGTTGSRPNAAERGILSISDFSRPDDLKTEDVDGSSHALWKGPSGFTGMFASQSGGSWIMCNDCAFDGWAIPPDIAALFARTIHTTGRAGWAIQNFLTTYTESWYAQILPQFDVAANIDVTFSTQIRIPRHWGGLVAALVMIIVNLICVWAITVLYVIHTRYSRQGNVWHTVSQIMSEDTRLILEQSNQLMDEDVEKRLKMDDCLVFLGKSKGSDKVSVLRP